MRGFAFLVVACSFFVAVALAVEAPEHPASTVELAAAKARQATIREAITTDFQKREQTARAWYTGEIDAFEKAAMAKGDLDTVVLARKEKERAAGAITPMEASALPAQLSAARAKLERGLAQLGAQQLTAEIDSVRAYVGKLEELQKQITQQGRVDEAIEVKSERLAAAQSLAMLQARKDLLPHDLAAAPPPAIPAAPAVAAAPALPVPAAAPGGMLGTIYVSVDDSVKLYLNGQLVHSAGIGPSRSRTLELRLGDRVVAMLKNKVGVRHFVLAFVALDESRVVSFRHLDMKNVLTPGAVDFTAEEFREWKRYAIPIKDHGHLPVKHYGESMWGDLNACTLGGIITREMVRPMPH